MKGILVAESQLQRELKKKGPFESLEQEAYISLLRTHSLLSVRFDRLFREHEISSPQYNILRILRGQKGDGLPSLEIASQMIACVPDITRLLDRLEKASYVKRERSTADRRVVNVRITPAGKKLLAKLDEPIREAEKASLGHMTKKQLAEMIHVLATAREREDANG